HADRHDNWIALGQRLVMAVFWWNGPLYALQPMIHGNREKLCDGRAVQVTGAAQALAHALLDVAARQVRQPALPLAVAGERSALAARIKRLASPDGLSHKRPVVTLAVLFPVLAVSALILTPRLGEASPASDASDGQAEIAYAAAHDGDVNAVRAMIEGGFDPDSPAPGDGTAMIGAVRGGHAGLVDMLLILGADPDVVVPGDGTALMAAARMGHVRLVKTLLEDGADPDLGSEGDGTPLILAAQKGHKIIAEYLLNAGADPNKAQPRDGNPLIAAARHGNKDLAHLLIKAGADPNGYVFRDETPLVNAARRGNIEMAKLLVSKGADVSLTVKAPAHDDSGPYRSPLSEAKRAQKSNMVAWLKQRGAEHRPPAE
ncbi:MAG: ankyrin repeat domain-containing protein, partial [Pseudomonadota bacterium]